MLRWIAFLLLLASMMGCSREPGDAVGGKTPRSSSEPTAAGTASALGATSDAATAGTQANVPRDERALSLALSIAPRSSKVGDEIEATVELASSGTEPVAVNARMALNSVHAPEPFRELSFEVKGPNGDKLPFLAKVRIGAPTAKDVRQLAPGEKLKKDYELTRYFDLGKPGSYSVRAHYASSPVADAKGRPAWTELVSSDTVEIERTR